MRQAVAIAALVALAAFVQVAWASRLEVAGAYPGVLLVAVVTLVWNVGSRAGLVAACAGGLLLDLGSAGPVGPHAVALLAGAYMTGLVAWKIERPRLVVMALTVAVATLLYSAALVLVNEGIGVSVPPVDVAVRLTLGAAIYNSVLALPAFALVRTLSLGRISRRAQA